MVPGPPYDTICMWRCRTRRVPRCRMSYLRRTRGFYCTVYCTGCRVTVLPCISPREFSIVVCSAVTPTGCTDYPSDRKVTVVIYYSYAIAESSGYCKPDAAFCIGMGDWRSSARTLLQSGDLAPGGVLLLLPAFQFAPTVFAAATYKAVA